MVNQGPRFVRICVDTVSDDGSGSVTILEAYRALLAADYRPVRTLEFHWYSAEVYSYLLWC